MAENGMGLAVYGQEEDRKRQQQMAELKDMQDQVAQNTAAMSPRGDASAGYGSEAGSFMAGLSSSISPELMGAAFSGNSGDKSKSAANQAGGMGLGAMMGKKSSSDKSAALGLAAGMGDSGSSGTWSTLTGIFSKLMK